MTSPAFNNSQLGNTIRTDKPSLFVGSSGIIFTDGSQQLTAFTGTPIVTETDPTVSGYIKNITVDQISQWDTAYSTLVAESGNWNNSANLVAISGNQWSEAYGWGDHSTQNYVNVSGLIETSGYLQSQIDTFIVSETDPIFTGSVAYSITSTDTGNWNSAYSWGDHATVGYLVSGNNISLLNNDAGYLTSADVSGITGNGTTNYIAKWTETNGIGDSIIYDNGTNVGIGTASPEEKLTVEPTNATTDLNGMSVRRNSGWSGSYLNKYLNYNWRDYIGVVAAMGARYDGTSVNIDFHSMYNAGYKTSSDVVMSIQGDGNVGIGTTSPSARLNVEGGNIIFNDLGGNYDFRVEGDTDTNLLFTDASTDRVGIGTSSPVQKLQVDTSQLEIAGFHYSPLMGPIGAKQLQSLIVESRGNSVILKHLENPFAGSTMELQNLIRYGSDFISIDAAYSGVLGITYYPKLKVNTSTGATTFNDAYTLPTADGSSGQALITDGSGNVSWINSITSNTTVASGSDVINNIISLTQAEYDASIVSSGTLYVITDNTTTSSNVILNQTVNGRLTLESGVPISTTGQTAKTTLYFTPYLGNQIALYNGTEWKIYSFAELSLSLSGYTANTNYDIFIYDNGGTLTLESTAWTNDTTRATSLATQDGVYVKSGATTRRYLGTIRITGTTGQCEDSDSRRFVWNYYNQVQRPLYATKVLNHTYTSATIRPWGNVITVGETRYQFVLGLSSLTTHYHQNWSRVMYVGLALDSTTTANALTYNQNTAGLYSHMALYNVYPSDGYHYIQAVEYTDNAAGASYLVTIDGTILG